MEFYRGTAAFPDAHERGQAHAQTPGRPPSSRTDGTALSYATEPSRSILNHHHHFYFEQLVFAKASWCWNFLFPNPIWHLESALLEGVQTGHRVAQPFLKECQASLPLSRWGLGLSLLPLCLVFLPQWFPFTRKPRPTGRWASSSEEKIKTQRKRLGQHRDTFSLSSTMQSLWILGSVQKLSTHLHKDECLQHRDRAHFI